MHGKSWGIDPELNKLTGDDVPLNDIWRDVEILRIIGVHYQAVHQLVVVEELLGIELFVNFVSHDRLRNCAFFVNIWPPFSDSFAF